MPDGAAAATSATRRASSRVQSAMYATYHMTNPAVFYNKEDQWEVPSIESGGRVGADGAVLHDHAAAGRDATPSSSRCCRSRRGARTTSRPGWWRAATASTTASCSCSSSRSRRWSSGPRQIVARINQDQVISPQITLWNQQGSEVIQGTLLVIPIEESLLYVRPLYLRAAGGKIPELKRVIVAYQNQIVMDETLDAALEKIFRKGVGIRPPEAETRRPAARRSRPQSRSTGGESRRGAGRRCARQHYDRALEAQRDGDWAHYGEEIKQLGAVLARMTKRPTPRAAAAAAEAVAAAGLEVDRPGPCRRATGRAAPRSSARRGRSARRRVRPEPLAHRRPPGRAPTRSNRTFTDGSDGVASRRPHDDPDLAVREAHERRRRVDAHQRR